MKEDCLKIAQAAIRLAVTYRKTPSIRSGIIICDEESFKGWRVSPEITQKKAGVYVELHKNGQLRGRMGTTSPTRDFLGEEIITSAIWAATKDPDFPALEPEELDQTSITLYILGQKQQIEEISQLNENQSLLVNSGWRNALELCDGRTREQLFSQAIKKASVENESFSMYSIDTERFVQK